ncbi:MAG: DinB family protein [Bacteroidetes bacterium]|nr:DinB family protein [Bacteroidota bacterium]
MNTKIEKIKNFRLFLLKQIEDLTTQQLNEIPTGYKNNIIWNLGHLICVQQNMCYVKSSLSVAVEDKYFSPFMPGTKPESFIEEQKIKNIKKVFINSIDKLHSVYDNNIYKNYSPSPTIQKAYGFEINNIDGALEYLLHHEGLHAGYILAIMHLL